MRSMPSKVVPHLLTFSLGIVLLSSLVVCLDASDDQGEDATVLYQLTSQGKSWLAPAQGKAQPTSNHKLLSGEACDAASICEDGLACSCLVANRGLHVCMTPTLLSQLKPPEWARHWERQGLVCEPKLPAGLEVMPPPPVAESGLEVVDPRHAKDTKLQEWARGPAKGWYTHYAVVRAPGTSKGVPILAGGDVPKEFVQKCAAAVNHFLNEAAVNNATLTSRLADHGIRILLGGTYGGAWQKHPEVKRHFITGLGGGAPWFPSTGIRANEPLNILMEELFHTIQYTFLEPMDVCMYHKAYAEAVANRLYTTDGSAEEVDGEPVPTVQADEYLAMTMQRWVGDSDGFGQEYNVAGNSDEVGGKTGREHLKAHDPHGFCLISKVFRSSDTWNPRSNAPFQINPNRGMDEGEVASFCKPILAKLASGCPSASLQWPYLQKMTTPVASEV